MVPLCLFLTLQDPACYAPAGLRSPLAGGRCSATPLWMQEGRPRPVGPKWRGPESTPPDAREALGVARVFEQKLAALESNGANPCCSVCWLPEHVCCCSALGAPQRRALQRLQDVRPVKICLYMHVKEFARKSNTGSLIKCARPLLDTEIFISGLPEHDAELERQIQERGPARCCAVFPSVDSRSVREFVAAANRVAKHRNPQDEQDERLTTNLTTNAEAGQPLLAIFVEGSWDQARRINKRLPADLPRVSLDLVQHYSGERQEAGEQDNRMNTLLAISHFLREIWTLDVEDQTGTAGLPMEVESTFEMMQKFLCGLILEKEQSLARLHGGKARHPDRPVLDQKRRRRFSNL